MREPPRLSTGGRDGPRPLGAHPSPRGGRAAEPLPVVVLTRVLVPSPIGLLGVEFADVRVIRLVFSPPPRERQRYQPLTKLRSDRLEEALGQLAEYFAGARRELRIDYDLSPSGLTEASRQLLLETTRIPYGETRTYQKLAAQAGSSDEYRNVRAVLMTNPIPILVPCHRVVPNRGGAGSYVGGAKRKDWLLRLESRTTAERTAGVDAAAEV